MTPPTNPCVDPRGGDVTGATSISTGADMRAIYLRSVLFLLGLIGFVLIESMTPPARAPIAPAAGFGHAGHAA